MKWWASLVVFGPLVLVITMAATLKLDVFRKPNHGETPQAVRGETAFESVCRCCEGFGSRPQSVLADIRFNHQWWSKAEAEQYYYGRITTAMSAWLSPMVNLEEKREIERDIRSCLAAMIKFAYSEEPPTEIQKLPWSDSPIGDCMQYYVADASWRSSTLADHSWRSRTLSNVVGMMGSILIYGRDYQTESVPPWVIQACTLPGWGDDVLRNHPTEDEVASSVRRLRDLGYDRNQVSLLLKAKSRYFQAYFENWMDYEQSYGFVWTEASRASHNKLQRLRNECYAAILAYVFDTSEQSQPEQ